MTDLQPAVSSLITSAHGENVVATAAEGIYSLGWLVIALPLAGAAVLLLGGRFTDRWGHLLGTATAVGSFGVGVAMFVSLLGRTTTRGRTRSTCGRGSRPTR